MYGRGVGALAVSKSGYSEGKQRDGEKKDGTLFWGRSGQTYINLWGKTHPRMSDS